MLNFGWFRIRIRQVPNVEDSCRPRVRQAGLFLAMPGAFVGLIVANGRLDDINFMLTDFVNFAFYFGLAFVAFTLIARVRRR